MFGNDKLKGKALLRRAFVLKARDYVIKILFWIKFKCLMSKPFF